MGLIISDGAGAAGTVSVGANFALRATLYDDQGAPGTILAKQDRTAIVPGTTRGMPGAGADYKIARLTRCSPDGALRSGEDTLLLYDSVEGAAVDTNKWIQTTTTMTIVQAAGTGIQFNAGSSVAATVGAMQNSHRRFPFMSRAAIAGRFRARATAHSNNNLHELGFGAPATATTASIGDGAVWRKDGTGQWVPVVSINGAEALGTPISNATFIASVATTDYCYFEIFLEESRATFTIVTQAGVIVNEQAVDFGATIGTFAVTHLQSLERTYNSAGTGVAVQLFVAQAAVWLMDTFGPNWQQSMAGLNYGSLTSPTAYTQLANYANSAAPASATLSNTAAGYTTLGGQWQFAAVATAETDFALFGFQVPAPYAFTVTRVQITSINMVAAVATTATILQWGLGFNSSAVSLATAAPYAPMRKVIGLQSFPIAAAISAMPSNPTVIWEGLETVQPSRFFHVILKVPIGTATATEIFRGTCDVSGYFE